LSDLNMQAVQITPAAEAWLQRGRPARPLQVFQHVCNLIDDKQSVLSLQTERLTPGPNSLLVAPDRWDGEGFARRVRIGSDISHEPGILVVGAITVEWREAVLWDPRPDWQALQDSRPDWQGKLAELRRLALSDSPPGGLSPLLAPEESSEPEPSLSASFVRAARPHAQRLIAALSQRDDPAMRAAARGLAGLGGGLTPSGDDYLVGAMHAIWSLQPQSIAVPLCLQLSRAAVPRTTPLSAEWLHAAARGEAGGHWHELLQSLRVGDEGALERSARGLMQVGHSSGADALAGFLGVLLP
jgi:hypothetical protein